MKKNASCDGCPNKNCFIGHIQSPEWKLKLSNSKHLFIQKPGQHIFLEGNPVFGIYFILEGKVKVTISGKGNKEQIVRLAKDGDVLGHRGLGGDFYPINAIAMEETVLCFVENSLLYSAFIANSEFTFEMMLFYSGELRKAEQRMRYLAQMNVREKTADALLFIRDSFGINDETKELNVEINREEIAGIAGTSVGQIIHNLSDLEKQKIIDKTGKKIQISDEKKLREIVSAFYP